MTEQEVSAHKPSDWQARLAAHVGERVRELRSAQRLSAQDVATICTERVGFKLLRTTLANLEAGTRKSVTLGEVIALAEALGTSPAALLFPLTRSRPVEYLPNEMHPAWTAWNHFTSPLLEMLGNAHAIPAEADVETYAVFAVAQLEYLQNGWRMFSTMRQNEHMPEGAKEAIEKEMGKTALGGANLLPNLRECGVDLSMFDGDFMAAVRRADEEGVLDAAPSA